MPSPPPSPGSLADIVPLPPALDAASDAGSSEWEASDAGYADGAGYADDAEPATTPPQPLGLQKRKLNHKAQRDANARLRRQNKRRRTAAAQTPTALRTPTFDEAPSSIPTGLRGEADFPANSTGFSALCKAALKADEVWTLSELREKEVFEWDGK